MPQVPSPFEDRELPEATLYLYVDGIDLTPFANRSDLQNATLAFAQGDLEQFSVRLRHRSSQKRADGSTLIANLPLIREGMVPVLYIQKLTEDDPYEYNTLFSGKVIGKGIDDDDLRGSTVLSVATPMKSLKFHTTMVFENKGSLAERNDVARLREVGVRWANAEFDMTLPEWGHEVDDDLTYNITFPLPNFESDATFFVNGERFTPYTDRAIDDIVRDIMTDPGQESDAGYPVVSRQWWWEGRFIDQHNPTRGVKWHLVMAPGTGITHDYKLDLMDTPDPRFPGAYVYDKGANLSIDYNTVVRRVTVSGDDPPVTPDIQIEPGMITMIASGASRGHAPFYHINTPAAGWVRKLYGSEDAWDSAVGGNDILPESVPWLKRITQLVNDFNLYFRVQETYLFHDAFRGPDTNVIDRTEMYEPLDPAFPQGQWLPTFFDAVEATHNTMARVSNRAKPHFPRGMAMMLADARASTCIVRGEPGEPGEGAALMFRAIRSTDPTLHTLVSSFILIVVGGKWHLYKYTGAGLLDTQLDSGSGHDLYNSDGHPFRLKVALLHRTVQVFFDDTIDDTFTQVGDAFNEHETLHGVGALAAAGASGVIWRDFSVTEFWGDKAMGVGAEDSGTEWSWIGYGYTINEDQTFSLIRGGRITSNSYLTPLTGGTIGPLGLGDYGQGGTQYDYDTLNTYQGLHEGLMPDDVPYLWEDIDRAAKKFYGNVAGNNIGFAYNDVFRITGVKYMDDATASVMFKVQWWYQPGGAGELTLLREELALPYDTVEPHYREDNNTNWPDPQPDHFWYVQAALKDLGTTFTYITVTPDFEDTFLPTGDLARCLTPLQGDFPATGTIRHTRFNSYIRRKRIADAVLREFGNERVTLNCTVHPPVQGSYVVQPFLRGDIVRVTCRRAGWLLPPDCAERIDDGCGPGPDDCDTRRWLVVRSIKRIEGGARSRRPAYQLVLGSKQYDIADPTRTHLLMGNVTQDDLIYNYSVPETGLVGFVGNSNSGIVSFKEVDQTGNTFFGVSTEIRIKAAGATAWLPTLTWPAGVRAMQIPNGMLPPNTKYEAQHRTIGKGGKASKWSPTYTGTMPPMPSYDRPVKLGFGIGDGSDVIPVTADSNMQQEWQLNEGCALTAWDIVHNGTGEGNNITVDIQWCSARDRVEYGLDHYASLTGSGAKPYSAYLDRAHSGNANQGMDFRGWDDKRTQLKHGDWLRVVVTAVSDTTNATTGTVMLTLTRAEVGATS